MFSTKGDRVSALFLPTCQDLTCTSSARLKYNLPTYRYLSAGNFSNITPRYWLGAMHSCKFCPPLNPTFHLPTLANQLQADLPLVFGTHYEFRGNSTDLEWQTASAYQDAWVSFAADSSGDLMYGAGAKWPRYSASGDTTLVFGGNGTAAMLAPGAYADSFINCSAPQIGPS